MPSLPRLTPAEHCPDEDCHVPIGGKHHRDCGVAICVTTGHQRILHSAAPPDSLIPFPELAVIDDTFLNLHVCGEDVWSGYPHGAVEAAAAGLFVRERGPDDPRHRRWLSCDPSHPDAMPDLDTVTRAGDWDMIRQVWVIPQEMTSRG